MHGRNPSSVPIMRSLAVAGGIAVVAAVAAAGWCGDGGMDDVAGDGATFAPLGPDRTGMLVTSLRTGGAGVRAGLRVGDVIDAIDGRPDPDGEDMRRAVRRSVARLHVVARGDAGARTLLLRRREVASREDPDRRGR